MRMGSCARRVFPAAVIAAVQEQMKGITVFNPPEIPASMTLQPSMRASDLFDATLAALDIRSSPELSVKETDIFRGKELIQKHLGKKGAICFVVRRPGCALCREHAMTLSALADMYGQPGNGDANSVSGVKHNPFDEFDMFGIVKEIGVDDEGLAEFKEQYFDYPLYADKTLTFYQALGGRKLGLGTLFNPFALYSILISSTSRAKTKSIAGNLKGEGMLQGGIIIFGKDGKPRSMYQEETGKELPVVDIFNAVYAVSRDE